MNNTTVLLLAAFITLAVAGCKTGELALQPADHKVPASFKGGSVSAAEVPAVRQVFTDRVLLALMDSALIHNADLLIAYQRVEAARANLRASKGALYPSLDVNLSAGGTQYGKYTIDGVGNTASPEIPSPVTPDYFAGLASSWEADVWGKLRNRKKAAQLRYLATEAGKNYVITNLLAEIAYRYYTLVSLDEEHKIILENVKLQENALEIVKLQKTGGRANELAVKQFEAQLMHTRSLEYQVKQEIIAAENELNFLAGRYPTTIERNGSKEPIAAFITGIPADMLRNRPDIVQAELELAASHADVKAARAAFYPSVTLSGAIGYNAYNMTHLFDPSSFAFSFLGNLVSPVFNRYMIKANYELMKAQHKETWHRYGKTVMNAFYEVSTTIETMAQIREQYRLNEQEANTLDEAVSISNDLYLAGYANYLEVITAQKNALEADLTVAKMRKRMQFATINLYRALGGGWKG